MIHIIVYSTTDTVAKMYKIKKFKKGPFQSNSGGRGEWLRLLQYIFEAVGGATSNHCVVLYRWWLVVSSKGI